MALCAGVDTAIDLCWLRLLVGLSICVDCGCWYGYIFALGVGTAIDSRRVLVWLLVLVLV